MSTGANHRAQRDRILQILLAANGREVPLPDITALASQYNARIHELRRRGWPISNRKQRMPDGTIHSWFKLEPVTPAQREAVAVEARNITRLKPSQGISANEGRSAEIGGTASLVSGSRLCGPMPVSQSRLFPSDALRGEHYE